MGTFDRLIASENMEIRHKISSIFAYKAEWLQQGMFSLYTEPAYFPDITGSENCLLIGGRGTGKTTVLKGLSYIGQENLNKNTFVSDRNYYGLYYRVDSSRVSAFKGLNRTDEEWSKPFAHYINLIVANLVADLLDWYTERTHLSIDFNREEWAKFKASLSLDIFTSVKELQSSLHQEIIKFERYINNIANKNDYEFSILGSPIDDIFKALEFTSEFKGKTFFIIFDEYENFSDYQQQIVNTLIKEAAGKSFCFKVGVREQGWRNKITLNNQELRSPRDYRKIDIKEKLDGHFGIFAEKICNDRINLLFNTDNKHYNINKILPGLTIEEEAKLLGVEKLVKAQKIGNSSYPELNNKSPLFTWFLIKWARDHNEDIDKAYASYISDKKKWEDRYENYKYATLFTLNPGKGTGNLRKLYCGWKTYLLLASYNIAFILQLVETALIEQLNIQSSHEKLEPIQPKLQTLAAIKVAKSNFDETEGLGINGPQIMMLVQGFGRIFEIFSKSLIYAPEINSFWIADKNEIQTEEQVAVGKLLNLAVSHLALQRSIANKLDSDDPRTYDYSLHPIFSPLFVFSHRRKRKTRINSMDVIDLINNQASTISRITQPNYDRKKAPNKYFDAGKPTGQDNYKGFASDQLSLF